MKQLTVRSGKGDKDRFTTFPATLTPLLQNHLAGVKTLHQQDSAQGHGEVYRPHALARKSPHATKAWGWQYVFPARDISVDPRSGVTHCHHVDPSVINKAIKVAVRRAGERGQLADRMTPSRDPIRSERRPTPCGACRDCSYRRSWGLRHSQGTLPTVWRMGRPLGVTQRKWPGHWGMSTERRWRCWRHYSSRRAQHPSGSRNPAGGARCRPPTHRALRLVDAVAQQDPQRWLDGGVTCVACGP
jgi:hypothetical protein